MEGTQTPAPWPWPRVLRLAIGSGLALVGTYVIMFRMFEVGFEISSSFSREPLLWGTAAVVVGLIILSAPWFPKAPWWRGHER